MARKKNKAASRRRMYRWISTGAVTFSFIGFLVYLSNLPQPDTDQAMNVFNRSSVEAHAKTTADAPVVQYTFYKDLPELKVLVKEVAENLPERVQKIADASTEKVANKKETFQIEKKEKLAVIPEKKKSVERVAVKTQDKPDKSKEKLALQSDAFSSFAEADHRRAELLLMGLNAHIEKIQANGTTRYRVLVGPFAAREGVSNSGNI